MVCVYASEKKCNKLHGDISTNIGWVYTIFIFRITVDVLLYFSIVTL